MSTTAWPLKEQDLKESFRNTDRREAGGWGHGKESTAQREKREGRETDGGICEQGGGFEQGKLRIICANALRRGVNLDSRLEIAGLAAQH